MLSTPVLAWAAAILAALPNPASATPSEQQPKVPANRVREAEALVPYETGSLTLHGEISRDPGLIRVDKVDHPFRGTLIKSKVNAPPDPQYRHESPRHHYRRGDGYLSRIDVPIPHPDSDLDYDSGSYSDTDFDTIDSAAVTEENSNFLLTPKDLFPGWESDSDTDCSTDFPPSSSSHCLTSRSVYSSQDNQPKDGGLPLEKRGNIPTCTRSKAHMHTQRRWSITYQGDSQLNGEHCGQTVKKAIKRHVRCRPLTDWTCVASGKKEDDEVTIGFHTGNLCSDSSIHKAVKKGTRGRVGVWCKHT